MPLLPLSLISHFSTKTFLVPHFSCGVSLILPFAFTLPSLAVVVIVMFCKILASASYSIINVHCNEILPTNYRATIRGLISFVAS